MIFCKLCKLFFKYSKSIYGRYGKIEKMIPGVMESIIVLSVYFPFENWILRKIIPIYETDLSINDFTTRNIICPRILRIYNFISIFKNIC